MTDYTRQELAGWRKYAEDASVAAFVTPVSMTAGELLRLIAMAKRALPSEATEAEIERVAEAIGGSGCAHNPDELRELALVAITALRNGNESGESNAGL